MIGDVRFDSRQNRSSRHGAQTEVNRLYQLCCSLSKSTDRKRSQSPTQGRPGSSVRRSSEKGPRWRFPTQPEHLLLLRKERLESPWPQSCSR